ncbi:hypothetical protein [Streptomyces varsoviensis]|uniref:Uncharacterized protein n=1 Tax=Streptomyces varsoviensis TaxID=67373 RepID=A0ABR5J949_9ACTN|nr:hypothetical protein [Streptomyces varsoviensis]KOG89887.1 hypothetical protein ADK38_11775 [Streptomyces varsoviensis]
MTKMVQALTDRLVERLLPGGTAHAVKCHRAGTKCINSSCGGKKNYLQYRVNCDDGSYYYEFAHCGC